jgi:AraC-like DNA-binding protein
MQPKAAARPLDRAVQKALALMRTDLADRWTVTRLARRVGLSRPVFARRFVEQVGTSPLRYLTSRRMECAAELLEVSDLGLAQIAKRVGYDSEFAFNRAFKRHHQVAPGAFRRERWNVQRVQQRQGTPTLRIAA